LLQFKPRLNMSSCTNKTILTELKKMQEMRLRQQTLPLLAASEFGRDKTKSGTLSKLNSDVARQISEYI
jgi:hypothetical protein